MSRGGLNRLFKFATSLLVASALVTTGQDLCGQVLQGRLLDARTDDPIPVGRIAVLDSTLKTMTFGLSNLSGRFNIDLNEADHFMIHASAASYLSYVEGPFSVTGADTLYLDFRIDPSPIALDSVVVLVDSRGGRLGRSGFYQRQDMEPSAVFMDREDLDEKGGMRTSDFFRQIPGVRISEDRFGTGARRILLRNRCRPALFLDGVRAQGPIEDFVYPEDVEGVEIYRGAAQTPLEFGGTNSRCGAIVIWTR